MFDLLEATATGTVDRSAELARRIQQTFRVPLSSAAHPETIDALRARLMAPDMGRLDLEARTALLEASIGAIAEAEPQAGRSFARLAVAALGPSSRFRRHEALAAAPAVRARHANMPSLGPGEGTGHPVRDAALLSDRIPLDEPAFRHLRDHSRMPDMDEAGWAARARLAIAAGILLEDVDYQQLVHLMGHDRVEAAFDGVEPGTLFLMFHAGYIRAAKRLFTQYVPANGKRGILLAPGGTHQAGADPRQALFGALRSLQDGHNLWVAPDGPLGKQSVTFDVLGTRSTGGEGAALLAHTARCPTVYFRLALDGDRLVPMIEPGPRAEKGERFADFSARFHRAYAAKLSELLTGDPANLVLRPRWMKLFAAAGENVQQLQKVA